MGGAKVQDLHRVSRHSPMFLAVSNDGVEIWGAAELLLVRRRAVLSFRSWKKGVPRKVLRLLVPVVFWNTTHPTVEASRGRGNSNSISCLVLLNTFERKSEEAE